MFYNATSFNQNINGWNTSKVTNMSEMFYAAKKFNQDISNWDVSHVKDMNKMFSYAKSFRNRNLTKWYVIRIKSKDKHKNFMTATGGGNKEPRWYPHDVIQYSTLSTHKINRWSYDSVREYDNAFNLNCIKYHRKNTCYTKDDNMIRMYYKSKGTSIIFKFDRAYEKSKLTFYNSTHIYYRATIKRAYMKFYNGSKEVAKIQFVRDVHVQEYYINKKYDRAVMYFTYNHPFTWEDMTLVVSPLD
jgi:surface protein